MDFVSSRAGHLKRNILTRNLMIFGQGAIRCHPYVFPEMEAARMDDLPAFDQHLWGHIGFSINRAVRAFTLGLTGARLAPSPQAGVTARYFREMTRFSSALAFVSDLTMGVLGGKLKFKERLSARLGDVLSQLYIASAVLKYYLHHGQQAADTPHMQWAIDNALHEIARAFDDFLANFPVAWARGIMRVVVFPVGNWYRPVSDVLNAKVADLLLEQTELRDRLTWLVFKNGGPHEAVGRLAGGVSHDLCELPSPVWRRRNDRSGSDRLGSEQSRLFAAKHCRSERRG